MYKSRIAALPEAEAPARPRALERINEPLASKCHGFLVRGIDQPVRRVSCPVSFRAGVGRVKLIELQLQRGLVRELAELPAARDAMLCQATAENGDTSAGVKRTRLQREDIHARGVAERVPETRADIPCLDDALPEGLGLGSG